MISKIDPAGLDVGQLGGRRNLILNGAMQVAQRGTSFTVTNEYGLDRWFCRENTDGALTFSQDSESPDGLSKSLKVNVDTADSSIGSSQFAYLAQRLEGYSIEPLAFGGSGAKSITLSFYVRCSVTGKFGGAIMNGSNNNRSYAFTYDVNSANTWERKTITLDGDTTGTWNIDNSQEMSVFWSLGAGADVKKAEGSWDSTAGVQSATEADTELVGNASATWYITGVQLEVGTVATPFEHRSYGEELALCQRYYYEKRQQGRRGGGIFSQNANRGQGRLYLPQVMRSIPTFTATRDFGDGIFASASITANNGFIDAIQPEYVDVEIDVDITSGAGNGGTFRFDFYFDAEL